MNPGVFSDQDFQGQEPEKKIDRLAAGTFSCDNFSHWDGTDRDEE